MSTNAHKLGKSSQEFILTNNLTSEKEFPNHRHLTWILTVFILYFGLRLLFFALKIPPSIPPDEITHFGVSQIFSHVFFLPVNSPETYQYGLVTNTPWLYYWIMGKLLHLNFFGMSDLLFLRFFNILLAFGTVYFVWRTLRLLTDEKLPQILLIVAMTNTLMFSFLSAFVTYDNLANLLATASICYLLSFFKKRSGSLLVASLFCQLAGGLTKSSFLPLIPVLTLLLFVHEFKNLHLLLSALKELFRVSLKLSLTITLLLLIGVALNINLYGGNYVSYGSLTPDMADVLSPEIAMQSRIDARNIIFTLFKEGRVSKEKALEMTSYIRHSGDRKGAIFLIQNYDYQAHSGAPAISQLSYIPIWISTMFAGIFGISAHLGMPCGSAQMWLFITLAVMAGVAFVYRWRPRESGWLPAYLLVISGFYGVFLMYAVNYRIYLEFRAIPLALQGRYIFPVIGAIYVFISYYLIQLTRVNTLRVAIFALASLFFIVSDLPFFLSNVTPDWFAWPSR